MANRSGSGGKGGGGGGSAFDRDFGYLLPFLDKVAAAASTLPDAAARTELQRLMADEKVRWARARELLSGAQGRAGAGPAPAAAPLAAPARARPGDPHPQQPGAQLTVGSLKPER